MAPTHRDRFLAAVRHEETDRVPIDFGSLPTSGIHAAAYAPLLALLGFESESGNASFRDVIVPSERVLAHFDTDVRGVSLPDHREVVGPDSYRDEWGVVWERADPRSLFTTVEGPLERIDEPSTADLDRIHWPVTYEGPWVAGIRRRLESIRRETDCAAVLNLSNGPFSVAQRMRGFAGFLEDLLLRRAFAEALLERITDGLCSVATDVLGEVGDLVDCISFMDDLGSQEACLVSPSLYRATVKPSHARLLELIHRHTDAMVIMHSDGSIRSVMGDLIDCGVQVINPVQTSAKGMDAESLKADFGADLCFWGGVDIQEVLPNGTTHEVVAEVRHLVSTLGRGGGYVLASGQNMLGDVPPENIIAMFEAAVAVKLD